MSTVCKTTTDEFTLAFDQFQQVVAILRSDEQRQPEWTLSPAPSTDALIG